MKPYRINFEIEGPATNEKGKLVIIFVIMGERVEFEITGYDNGWKLKNTTDNDKS
jgi:hypothetical protein